MKNRISMACTAVLVFVLGSCIFDNDPNSGSNGGSYDKITVTPGSVTLSRGESQQFDTDRYYVDWSLEGITGGTQITSSGLLTVGADETASSFTVRAKRSGYTDGTARVTVPSLSATPSGLRASRPGPEGIELSWSPMEGAGEYLVYRSVNGKDYGQIARASTPSYTDDAASAGISYFYYISVNGVKSPPVFSFAAEYFSLPNFFQRKLIPIAGGAYQYYRFAVKSGSEYTIEWQDGENKDVAYWHGICVSAWQNDGTSIFVDATAGYANPRVFKASVSGFVTVEVRNTRGDGLLNYQIYCYGMDDNTSDPGTAALPPYKVEGFRVSSLGPNSINLSWDGVSDAVKYHVYRANTQQGVPGRIDESGSTSYQDSNVSPGVTYWYTIAAVNADGREGVRYQGAFGFAAPHYALSPYDNAQIFPLPGQEKHYYRLPVEKGKSYTIEWQDGENKDVAYWHGICVSAWQNDGTAIFADATAGYAKPREIKATGSGFVTIEVRNTRGDGSLNYQIYYY